MTTTETAAGPVADPPRWWRWLAMPVPLGRIAAFRVLIYAFVLGDILIFTGWVRNRVDVPTSEYQPLFIARHLPLPAPTPLVVRVVFWALLASAIVAALGWLPRIAGWVTFALYFEWLIVAMSYGKVDHDRFGLLVALAVLPTVGKARHGDERTSENAGWVLRFTQLACIATYFLSSWAKLRFGGIAWLTGATLTRAILRRGTDFGHLLLEIPHFGVISQFGIMAFELSSPLIFLARGRLRFAAVGGLFMFHLLVFLTISISFLAHLVAMTSFLPLERVRPVVRMRAWLGRAVQARSASLGNQR